MSMRPSTIWARANGRLERIAGPAEIAMDGIPPKPVKYAHPVGFWVPNRVFRSPDGRTLLAQWSGACETQTAYLVSVATGKVRGVFVSDARGIFVTYESTTHGWTADGHARVRLSYPIFETYSRVKVQAGMYDVDPVTLKRTLERRLPHGPHC
jgi:transposase InsO family protein